MSGWLTDPETGIRYKPPPTPEEGERRRKRMEELVGDPFIHLPGNPPQHKVLAEIDGFKIRVETVEMVWNDMKFIDAVCGVGDYKRDLEEESNTRQLKVLELAEKLYNAH